VEHYSILSLKQKGGKASDTVDFGGIFPLHSKFFSDSSFFKKRLSTENKSKIEILFVAADFSI